MKEARREEIAYWRPLILDDIQSSRHAIVEAAAGTGKTFTIEHLIVDLLRTTTLTIEQILVVTFTEKATAELRGRVRTLIEDILRGALSGAPAVDARKIVIDEEARSRLERAQWAFDRAAIFTIHGFCQRVLTELAFLTGTRFDLEVVDAHRPFHRAFRAELRERLAEHGDLLAAWLREGGDIDYLEALLLEAHQRRYLETNSARWREEVAERFRQSFDLATLERECRSIFTRPKQLNETLKALNELNQIVRSSRASGTALLRALAEFNFRPLVRAKERDLTPDEFAPLARFLRSTGELQFAAAIEAGKDEATALVERYLPAVAERLGRDKREMGQIDYEDMLLWVWRALEGPEGSALANVLRSRFSYGLADEFQDTDDLQWKILSRIFVEHNGGSRLFVVGDPKQAIYAFRGADVHAYLRACRQLRNAGARRVPLVTNFRSTARLIDALNHIFDQKAKEPFFSGEITYSDPAKCGLPDREAIDSSGNPARPVVLMRYPEGDGEPASAADAREAIGRHIASVLHKLLDVGSGGLTIREPDSAGRTNPRRVQPRDVFVLTRTRRESEEIGGYLRDRGVPFAFYKLEGLFQTREASDSLDVLKAIEEPRDRSRRLRAWSSRFFAVRYRDLATLGDVPESHPLNGRLFKWRAMAEEERFAELFDSLLHESGLAERELWFSRGERELTNFLHIFEVLLERAVTVRLGLAELIELLEGYITRREEPPGPDGNVQRLESEREAVQVMTVHMSKGLEADVVVLFGGSHRSPQRNKLSIYHSADERRFVIGSMQDLVRDELAREEAEENQRLLYVALTRARARVFLPLFPDGATKTRVDGSYKPLNDRLKSVVAGLEDPGSPAAKLFQIEDVGDSPPIAAKMASLALGEWSPPAALTSDDSERETVFARARRNHAALSMSSYTSLKHAERAAAWSIAPEDFKTDLEAEAPPTDLPGGSQVGIFLHDVIERLLELDTFGDDPNFESWQDRDDVKRLFRDSMRLHQVREPRWFDRGRRIVFNALTTRLAVGERRFIGPLHSCRSVREMEFIFPVPEQNHPGFAGSGGAQWTVERGFLKGFVDLVFEQDGLVYFADWKSDLLSSYERATIENHVKNNYDLQARIYLAGVLHLLRISGESEYAKRFGGLVFVFLRGVGTDGDGRQGIYFHRPSWSEVCGLNSELMNLPQLS